MGHITQGYLKVQCVRFGGVENLSVRGAVTPGGSDEK